MARLLQVQFKAAFRLRQSIGSESPTPWEIKSKLYDEAEEASWGRKFVWELHASSTETRILLLGTL